MLYGAQPPRRRDAQRNRAAIIEAATELMAGRCSTIVMPEIARRAGVGQATLYRHFPDRDALTSAVMAHHLTRLETMATANGDQPSLFRNLLAEALHTLIEMRPLVLHVLRLDPATRERYQRRVTAAFAGPLRSAQRHGHVRDDLAPDDLILLFTMVHGVIQGTDDIRVAKAAADRSIDLVLDGVFRPAWQGL